MFFLFVFSNTFSADKLNQESVHLIETGLFSVCLDSPVMRISDEKYAVKHTVRVFFLLCLTDLLSNPPQCRYHCVC